MNTKRGLLTDMLASVESDVQDLEAKLREARAAEKYLRRQMAELPDDDDTGGPFEKLTVVDAALAWLKRVGPPFRTSREVTEALLKGGLKTEAEKPQVTVFGSLNRAVKRGDTSLAKRDSKWGLRDWLKEDEKPEALPK